MVPEGVDPLLVEDDEPLALVVAAHLALELDHLLDPVTSILISWIHEALKTVP